MAGQLDDATTMILPSIRRTRQPRVQLAVLDTSGSTATLAPWSNNRYDRDHNSCAGVFDTFMRDIDFSPDGSSIVASSTGAFAGGVAAGTPYDTVSRWDTSSTGNDPTWSDYTGGDTTYGVAVTGALRDHTGRSGCMPPAHTRPA